MYLSSNKNEATASSSLPIVQFGTILHNSPPIVKKVHMQNVSHIPIRIDWLVYDTSEEIVEKPKLVELIPVIGDNPFDEFKPDTIEERDDTVSEATSSTSKRKNSLERQALPESHLKKSRIGASSRTRSTNSGRTLVSSANKRLPPLIKLYVKPYRGKRSPDKSGIYSASPLSKVNICLKIFKPEIRNCLLV